MKQLLSGQNIIKSYGVGEEKHRVLNGVSVTIGSGEFVSIMGPSGSGKSTLLYALSGMDGIDGGEVSFEGRKLIVFGDEPTGALNTKTAKEIMELFTKINRDGIAILLVTHDPNIAARTERVLFLCDGEIVDECRLSKFTKWDFDNRVGEITKRMQKIGI